MNDDNKRKSTRYNVEVPIRLMKFNTRDSLNGNMMNCSSDGIYFVSDKMIPKGTEVCVLMDHYFSEKQNGLPCEKFKGEVVWARKIPVQDTPEQHFGIGIQYLRSLKN